MQYLKDHWESIPRPVKIRRLQSLIDGGWKTRALARALKVVTESRIRQLLKLGGPTEPVNGRSDMREKPEVEETEPSSPEAATREESNAGGNAAKPAAPDYAIRNPGAGGQVLATWIRSNFKHPDWSGAIADYTTAYWFNRWSVHKEVELVNTLPAGLTPSEVIRCCLSDAIKAELEGGFFQDARRKWFACWTSILLPDPAIRRKAVEIAGQILQRPAARWSYMAFDPQLNQPTPCLRSQGTPLADFLEGLTKYVNFRSLLKDRGPLEAEVEEALRYAAATLREGSPPPLD